MKTLQENIKMMVFGVAEILDSIIHILTLTFLSARFGIVIMLLLDKIKYKEMNVRLFEWMLEATLKHRLKNLISSLLSIVDGIIDITTLGFVFSKLSLKWAIYSLKTGK